MVNDGDNNLWCSFKKFVCYGFKAPKVNKDSDEFYANLRKLRVELQDLVKMAARAKSGNLSLHNHKGYIDKTFDDIGILITNIEKEESNSDSLRHIINIWEQMSNSKKILKKKDTKEDHAGYLQFLTLLEEQAQEIVLYIGIKTIPPRINKWLMDTHSGAILPFHLLFEDELLSDADRQKVLEYISWKPKAINGGLVDPDTGFIYRYPDCLWVRILRNMLLVLVIVMMSCLIYYYGSDIVRAAIDDSNGEISINNSELLWGWFALQTGVLVHLLVAKTKEKNMTGRRSIMPMSVWGYYLAAHTGSILFKLALALFAYVGLLVLIDIPKFAVAQAFLVGYSLNSFIGVFSAGLDSRASAQLDSFQKQAGLKQ